MASLPQKNNSHQGPVASLPCTMPQQNNSYQSPVPLPSCTVVQQNNHYQGPVASSPWSVPQQNNSYPVPQQNSYQGPSTVPQQNNSYQGPSTVPQQNNSYQGPGTVPQQNNSYQDPGTVPQQNNSYNSYQVPSTVQHQNNFFNNSYPGPVAVLWDIENCQVPSNVCPEDVAGNIRMALRHHPVVQGAVTLFSAYGDFNSFPRRLREGCQRTGVKLVDVPNGRKDAADKAILVDMFLFALDNRPPCSIVLISGDVDFAPALHILGQRGYTVILVIPTGVGVRVSLALSNASRYVWEWPRIARGEGFVPPADGYLTGGRVSEKADGHDKEASNKKPRTEEQPQDKRGCYKCMEHHPGKKCDGTDVICYECNQPGHKKHQCTQKVKAEGHDEEASIYQGLAQSQNDSHTGEASNKKPRIDKQPEKQPLCYKCRKPYHPGKSCDGTDISCYVCKQPGHMSHQCAHKIDRKVKEEATTASNVADKLSSLSKPQGQKSNECTHKSARKVKVKGMVTRARKAKLKGASKCSHIKSNACAHKSARKAKDKAATTSSNGDDLSCFECKQKGHKSNECPHKQAREAKGKGETMASNGAHMVCVACNHLGHLSFECPLKWLGKGKGKGIMLATDGEAPKVPEASAKAQKALVAPAKHMVVVEPNLVEPIIRPDIVAAKPDLVEPIVGPAMVAVEPMMTNEVCPVQVERHLAEPNMSVDSNMMNDDCIIRVEPNRMNGERPIRIIEKENRTLRNNKIIPMVKVLWKSQISEKEIWETESSMREKHQELFI